MKKTVFTKKSNVKPKVSIDKDHKTWKIFAEKEKLSAAQLAQFVRYYELLVSENDIGCKE